MMQLVDLARCVSF
ncbi:hypothetical protein AB4U07_004363 [Escherichia coli]|nr:hypothetical protein [Escherichia coli]